MSERSTRRVVARYLEAKGLRQEVHRLTKPINTPKGFSHETLKEYVKTEDIHDDTVVPFHTDVRPQDVFSPKPKNMAVLNYARHGWPGDASSYTDMEHATRVQIPKDKGHDAVSNLSQYLVRTEGGGSAEAVGQKTK